MTTNPVPLYNLDSNGTVGVDSLLVRFNVVKRDGNGVGALIEDTKHGTFTTTTNSVVNVETITNRNNKAFYADAVLIGNYTVGGLAPGSIVFKQSIRGLVDGTGNIVNSSAIDNVTNKFPAGINSTAVWGSPTATTYALRVTPDAAQTIKWSYSITYRFSP
jgi:hypothetical protein